MSSPFVIAVKGASLVLVALALAGCVPQKTTQEDNGYGLQGYSPPASSAARAACLAVGGKYLPAGLAGGLTCFTTPKDAGKSCSKSTDCESECLARSRSCAPVTPLFGCNATLDASGREVTLCVD